MASNSASSWNQKVIDEFRANGGTVTAAPFGRTLVLLHHVGAKSGEERVTPVVHIRQDADTWLIAASKGGAPDNPAWYYNLLAQPDTTIETPDDGSVPVHAVELKDDERDSAWTRFTAARPGFRSYEEKTTRTIPVLALQRRFS